MKKIKPIKEQIVWSTTAVSEIRYEISTPDKGMYYEFKDMIIDLISPIKDKRK